MDVDNYLRAVRALVQSLNISLDEAIDRVKVPEDIVERLKEKYESETTIPIRKVNMITSSPEPHSWFENWQTSKGYYWPRQRSYLLDILGMSDDAVRLIDDSTDKILSRFEDPRPGGPTEFDTRGLVMGYVQSGKTANYCALIAKAADLGYKFVIVLSGIHNSLRLQTQRRVNRALGIDPSGALRPQQGLRWISVTEPEMNGDFRPGTVDANLLQGNEKVVLVCKKNKSVLQRLLVWLRDNPPTDDLPVLVVDDEADLASINTGGNRPPLEVETDLTAEDVDSLEEKEKETDPSVINGMIRELLGSFKRVCYVAYTATPFANILINHLALDREVFRDLYPKDFIVSLPKPRGYCGTETLFGRESLPGEEEDVEGLEIIETVPDNEAVSLQPESLSLPQFKPEVPESLKNAFMDFVLGTACRMYREGTDFPSTMLVHVHQRVAVQNILGKMVKQFVSEQRDMWRYNRDVSGTYRERWENNFRPVTASLDTEKDIEFEKIAPLIDKLFHDPIPVIILNSDSEDELDYEKERNIKTVIIGGNRLSRGLTLEGLITSYYTRETDQYDTLMQMGRWFGFREDYVDLTRIYTTETLKNHFHDLAIAEEELRMEIVRYEKEHLTPLDFGPRIRSHPVMMVTARNKMGSARIIDQSYNGRLIQSTIFRLKDRDWLLKNLEAGAKLVSDLACPSDDTNNKSFPTWNNVSWRSVDEFFKNYAFDPDSMYEASAIRQYIKRQTDQGELTRWIVSIRGEQEESDLGKETSLESCGWKINRISRSRLRDYKNSIGSLVTPSTYKKPQPSGDEEIGLTKENIEAALEVAHQNIDDRPNVHFTQSLRRSRSKEEGVLLLYPISPFSKPKANTRNRVDLFDDPKEEITVLGVAVVFPESESAATIEYVVGSVGSVGREGSTFNDN
jgi:hypothetical protein